MLVQCGLHFKNILFLRVESAKLASYAWKALAIMGITRLGQETALSLYVLVWQSKKCDKALSSHPRGL